MPNAVAGWIEVGIATLFFGSNFVPVKRFETYDGMFYQWVMCAAIWMTGLAVQLFIFAFPEGDDEKMAHGLVNVTAEERLLSGRPDPYSVKFVPMAALGGALWATGNTMCVPVINMIGLSLGLLIWGSTNMVMGWATGMYGLFDTSKNALHNPTLNYTGVVLALVALAMYTQIETGPPAARPSSSAAVNGGVPDMELDDVLLTAPDMRAKRGNRVAGVSMAVIAGILFGNTFTPPNYLHDNGLGPKNQIDYVFSHFCGIFATSTLWFVVYCAVMRGAPMINPRLTLPAMLSGVMWAIAQTCWFLANTDLGGTSISFPITTSGPGIISALWGVFVFGEIQGTRNYLVLCAAITMACVGCTLIALSK